MLNVRRRLLQTLRGGETLRWSCDLKITPYQRRKTLTDRRQDLRRANICWACVRNLRSVMPTVQSHSVNMNEVFIQVEGDFWWWVEESAPIRLAKLLQTNCTRKCCHRYSIDALHCPSKVASLRALLKLLICVGAQCLRQLADQTACKLEIVTYTWPNGNDSGDNMLQANASTHNEPAAVVGDCTFWR